MYESGVSPVARVILIALVLLLAALLIFAGTGCSCPCAHASEVQIVTQEGATHSFF